MGLDLILEGSARAGYEAEWLRLVERSFANSATPDGELSDAEFARFDEISIPAYARIGAPRVGTDAEADAWIIEAKRAQTPEDAAIVLREFDGYHVLRLCKCDGIPAYSNAACMKVLMKRVFAALFSKIVATSSIFSCWKLHGKTSFPKRQLTTEKPF